MNQTSATFEDQTNSKRWYQWHVATWIVMYCLMVFGTVLNVVPVQLMKSFHHTNPFEWTFGWPFSITHFPSKTQFTIETGSKAVEYPTYTPEWQIPIRLFVNILVVLSLMGSMGWLVEHWIRKRFQFRIRDIGWLTLWVACVFGLSRNSFMENREWGFILALLILLGSGSFTFYILFDLRQRLSSSRSDLEKQLHEKTKR